jgi:hypothetical protein
MVYGWQLTVPHQVMEPEKLVVTGLAKSQITGSVRDPSKETAAPAPAVDWPKNPTIPEGYWSPMVSPVMGPE